MRAFGVDKPGVGIENAKHLDVPEPVPSAGEVVVEMKATSINAADVKIAGWRDGASFIHKKVSPLLLGYDISGVVVKAAGELREGEEVFGFLPYTGKTATGAMAERVCVDATLLARKPSELSHADAASMATVGSTALQVLRDKASVTAGQHVLINGASGGAGASGVAVAKQLGAHVTALCSAKKHDFVQGLGADEVLDYRSSPIASLDGTYDVVFDAACASSYGACKRVLAPAGHYITLLPSPAFILGKLACLFSKRSVHFISVASKPADLAQLAGWRTAGMPTAVTETFPFEDAVSAFERYGTGAAAGKIAITFA